MIYINYIKEHWREKERRKKGKETKRENYYKILHKNLKYYHLI